MINAENEWARTPEIKNSRYLEYVTHVPSTVIAHASNKQKTYGETTDIPLE